MKYLTLFSIHNLALLNDWLQETGELYTDVYLPRTARTSDCYFIHAMDDLKSLVEQQSRSQMVLTIFHRRQYPLRGIADETLLEQALEQIPDGECYTIVSLSKFPSSVKFSGSGKSHAELRHEFAEILGEEVGIGHEPCVVHDKMWFKRQLDEVFEATVLARDQYAIVKNQDYYEPYAKEPERYHWLEELWVK